MSICIQYDILCTQMRYYSGMDIQQYLLAILAFLNDIIVPFLLILAFLFFLWNAVKFFIIHSDEEDGRESAKRLATWGIAAFVLIVSIWGIVNMLVFDFGFGGQSPIQPDYMGTTKDTEGLNQLINESLQNWDPESGLPPPPY